MASQKGAELPPGSPEYRWVANVIRSVERRTGSPTRWSGRVFEEMGAGVLGTAHPDGSMTVSPGKVLAPVRLAYTAGRPLTGQENLRARDAAATVAHEAVHLSSRFGDPDTPGAYPTHDGMVPLGRSRKARPSAGPIATSMVSSPTSGWTGPLLVCWRSRRWTPIPRTPRRRRT